MALKSLRFRVWPDFFTQFHSFSWSFRVQRNLSVTVPLLAGHNKWSKVKNIKIPLDRQKSTAMNKIIAQINNIFANDKNASLENSYQLQKVFQAALDAGHPKVKLMNALESARKARPEAITVKVTSPTLDAHFIVKAFCMFRDETQMFNRSIRKLCEKQSLTREIQNLNAGYIDDHFQPKTVASVVSMEGNALSEDDAFDIGLSVEAEEIEFNEETKEWMYISSGVEYQKMRTLIEKHGVTVNSCEIVLVPYMAHQFTTSEDLEAAENLFSSLSSLDNVESVYRNYDDTLKT